MKTSNVRDLSAATIVPDALNLVATIDMVAALAGSSTVEESDCNNVGEKPSQFHLLRCRTKPALCPYRRYIVPVI